MYVIAKLEREEVSCARSTAEERAGKTVPQWRGRLETLCLSADIVLMPVIGNDPKEQPYVVCLNREGEECGIVGHGHALPNGITPESEVLVTLDDPTWPQPIHCSVRGYSSMEDGEMHYELIWDRQIKSFGS